MFTWLYSSAFWYLYYMLYIHAPCTWIQRLKIKNTEHKNSLLIYFETRSYLVWCRLYGCYHSLCGCYGDHLEENMAQILEGYQGGCWNSQKHLCKSKPDPCFVFPDSVGFRNQRSFFFYFLLFTYTCFLIKGNILNIKYTIRLRLWPKLAFVLHRAQYFAGSTMKFWKAVI